MEKLSSLDVSRYIRFLAMNRYHVALNRTQVNILLYVCFAYYHVLNNSTESPLSDAEAPKAWLYGPTFPRAYNLFDDYNFSIKTRVKSRIEQDPMWSRIVPFVVDKFRRYSSFDLVRWVQRVGTPWHVTVFGTEGTSSELKWDAPIDNGLTLDYFKP